jgi:hypothetical protein
MFVIVTVHLSPAYRTVRRVDCFLLTHQFPALYLAAFLAAPVQMLMQ